MDYRSTINLTGNFSVEFNILVGDPNSGFSLALVSGINPAPTVHTGVYFYGNSGYLFDKNDNFAGGYKSGQAIKIKCDVFENRYSYSFNDLPCNNNIAATNPVNYIEYSKSDSTPITLKFRFTSGQTV